MKINKLYFILLLNFHFNLMNSNSDSHLIGCYVNGGFFSIFITALNNLEWCEKHNKVPIIYWNEKCLYYQKEGYNNSYNAWEYYFEPVSNLSYENFKNKKIKTYLFAPDGSGIKHGVYNGFKMIECRFRANEIIKKFIRIKSNIIQKIDEFYKLNMENKKTIGIHLRGTDKSSEIKLIDPMNIINEANKFQEYQFFIASDEEKLLKLAIKNLKGNVIYRDCKRSKYGSAIHTTSYINKNKALLGEEALIDAILLSRCNILLHTHSNLSYAAHYFNPNLEAILFVDNQLPQLINKESYEYGI